MVAQRPKKIINMPLTAENDNVRQEKKNYSCLHYLKICLWNKFFCFKGRARRKEYITFQTFDFIVALYFYDIIHYAVVDSSAAYMIYRVISTILIVPLMSVTVRRLHDAGFSGWWCLLGVIPYLAVVFLVIKDSERSDNKYGEVPEGKTFGAPIWSNYAFRMAYKNSNIVTFDSSSENIIKRRKKVA